MGAHRTDTDCAAANSCTNHMYIGTPHSSMTFEYNVNCVNTSYDFPSICLCDYEDYVQDSHERFVGANQDKWDHWLDQHIGFYATYLTDVNKTQCEMMTMVQKDLDAL